MAVEYPRGYLLIRSVRIHIIRIQKMFHVQHVLQRFITPHLSIRQLAIDLVGLHQAGGQEATLAEFYLHHNRWILLRGESPAHERRHSKGGPH